MNWTDIFIRRPVLSLVVSAVILVFGLKAIGSLPVNQYPQTQNAIVTITTAYYGADPETIAGFITQPLEASIAQAQGIDYLSSASVSGVSTIIATLKLNYDSNAALMQIQTQKFLKKSSVFFKTNLQAIKETKKLPKESVKR